MKEMKFRTYGNEHLSRAIQELLFELGYAWGASGDHVLHVDIGFLGVNHSGTIHCWGTETAFEEFARGEETTIYDLIEMLNKKETIEIGGQKYCKKDVESALKDLKPL